MLTRAKQASALLVQRGSWKCRAKRPLQTLRWSRHPVFQHTGYGNFSMSGMLKRPTETRRASVSTQNEPVATFRDSRRSAPPHYWLEWSACITPGKISSSGDDFFLPQLVQCCLNPALIIRWLDKACTTDFPHIGNDVEFAIENKVAEPPADQLLERRPLQGMASDQILPFACKRRHLSLQRHRLRR